MASRYSQGEPRRRYKPESGKAERHIKKVKKVAEKVKKAAKKIWRPASRKNRRTGGVTANDNFKYLKGVKME